MFFKAYFNSRDAAAKFAAVRNSELESDGEWFVTTDAGDAAFDAGAYRILPLLDMPRKQTFTIKVVDDNGRVLETVKAQGTLMDVSPADVGMEPLF